MLGFVRLGSAGYFETSYMVMMGLGLREQVAFKQ